MLENAGTSAGTEFRPLSWDKWRTKALLQEQHLCSATFSAKTVCFIVVQSVSCVWLFVMPWTAACQVSLSFTISWCLLKLISIESVMPSNYFMLCRTLLLLPSIFSSIRVFYNELVLQIMWPKYWSFSFSISPSNEYLGLTSFKIDWLDFLAVQETLKSLLQKHSSKALILWPSAFFTVQLTSVHDYWKKHTFVSKVIFFFNTLSRFVIVVLARSKCLLISWLQSSSARILEPKERKSVTGTHFPFPFAIKWWDWMPWS